MDMLIRRECLQKCIDVSLRAVWKGAPRESAEHGTKETMIGPVAISTCLYIGMSSYMKRINVAAGKSRQNSSGSIHLGAAPIGIR